MPHHTSVNQLLMTFLPTQGTKQAYAAALAFIALNQDKTPKREHHFITFAGEPGRGKTHLALGIGWQWLGQQLGTVKYWHVSELLDTMRAEFDNPPQSESGMPLVHEFEKCKLATLLILDDLGVEKSTPWAMEKLDTLINHRWLEELPTVFTTNLAPGQLQPRIRSRIREGITVTLEGIDYREYKAKMRKGEK